MDEKTVKKKTRYVLLGRNEEGGVAPWKLVFAVSR
jgi:hypothetical protein